MHKTLDTTPVIPTAIRPITPVARLVTTSTVPRPVIVAPQVRPSITPIQPLPVIMPVVRPSITPIQPLPVIMPVVRPSITPIAPITIARPPIAPITIARPSVVPIKHVIHLQQPLEDLTTDQHNQFDRLNERLDNLLAEARRLSGKDLAIYTKERFVDIGHMDNNRFYTYARIELDTGDIYPQSGKKPRSNIFAAPWYGFDVIGTYGVITNDQKYARRVAELTQ